MNQAQPQITRWVSISLLVCAATLGCGKQPTPPAPGPTPSGAPDRAGEKETPWSQLHNLAYERSAYYANLEEWPEAREAMAPILKDERATSEDWVRAATIEMQAGAPAQAKLYLERGQVDGKDSPAARYVRARLASMESDSLETARGLYEGLLQEVPQCLATKYALGRVLEDMDPPDDATWEANQARAQDLYRQVLDLGLENGGAWYVSALYRMYVLSLEDPDPSVRAKYEAAWRGLESVGAKAVSVSVLNEGTLAVIAPPKPQGNTARPTRGAPEYRLRSKLAMPAEASDLQVHDFNGDRLADLAWLDGQGLTVQLQGEAGSFEARAWLGSKATRWLAADLSRDGYLDLLVAEGAEVVLYDVDAPTGEANDFAPKPSGIRVSLPAAPADWTWIDYDHDGDLDVLAVGSFGLRLLRNDGAGRIPERPADQARGGFTDVTDTLGVACTRPLAWCAIEDFDADQDVDFLVGGEGITLLASSLRGGAFEDRTEAFFGAQRPNASKPMLADVDGDGLVDALYARDGLLQWRFQGGPERDRQILTQAQVTPLATDLDLDGQVDVIWPENDRLATGLLAAGQDSQTPLKLAAPEGPSLGLMVAEMDRDPKAPVAFEVLRRTPSSLEIWENPKPQGNGLRLGYHGKKDNADGIGAVVEVRAAGLYRRVFYRGSEVIFGLGQAPRADVVRVTWPNGVSRSELDVEGGDPLAEDPGLGIQTEGLIGSCPFLYAWNGESYGFISDVLGITPLGLPMAPGMLVPPDHDEYVLVKGSQLQPKDGFYELQFTEELREVTYLDRTQLLVIDHPVGSELQPNERFCFPPFPTPEPQLFADPLPPIRAMGSDGQDWSSELAQVDDRYATPAKPLRGQFLGLSEPHWLELAFDPDQTQGAKRLRLVCTGWFYWTDASVNMATAYTPDLEFTPPILSVPVAGPDGETWVPIGPPVGFPAGKTKTMVLDLTGLIDASDPRIRIDCSLTLYWDALRLAVGDMDGTQRVTTLEPTSADLWDRGFSAPILSTDPTQPERFDWNVLATGPRWNQHPGMYTRYGDCLPLLLAIDDRFVILGSGDALTLRFDAGQVPALAPGFQRSFLVFFDGWAKDRDPNTVQALAVEPLPFHGMGSYPYPADKAFPSDESHERWRREWNTRPARQRIAPLSTQQLDAWIGRDPWPTLATVQRR